MPARWQRLNTPWSDGITHLVMSPLEFIQRFSALAQRLHLTSDRLFLAAEGQLGGTESRDWQFRKGRLPAHTSDR